MESIPSCYDREGEEQSWVVKHSLPERFEEDSQHSYAKLHGNTYRKWGGETTVFQYVVICLWLVHSCQTVPKYQLALFCPCHTSNSTGLAMKSIAAHTYLPTVCNISQIPISDVLYLLCQFFHWTGLNTHSNTHIAIHVASVHAVHDMFPWVTGQSEWLETWHTASHKGPVYTNLRDRWGAWLSQPSPSHLVECDPDSRATLPT